MGIWKTLQRLLDRAESRWALFLLVGGSGALSTWLATITDWLYVWGPIAWWGAFLAGSLITSVVVWFVSHAYTRWTLGRSARRALDETGTNALDTEFDRKLIRVPDFYSREYLPHKNKRFRNCRFLGPGNMLLHGGSLIHSEFRHCQIVVVDDDATLWGVTVLQDCVIDGSALENITLFFTRTVYESLPHDIKKHVPVRNTTKPIS